MIDIMSTAGALDPSPGTDSEPLSDVVEEICAANETLLRGRRQWWVGMRSPRGKR